MESSPSTAQNQPEIPAAGESTQPSDWKRMGLDILETLFLAVVLYFGINAVSARVRVDGFSMNPSLENGEYILVNKLAYRIGEPERGDIVVFSFPLDPNQDLIKRVIGLPGETITVQGGKVSVNGILLDEPYIAAAPFYNGTWVVNDGQLFVLGDNRNESKDSHEWGLLPMENVIGKAVLIYWPPPKWEVIDHVQPATAAQ
ncbi:MAG: signal peptidase I [Chloroflexota bacterium]